MPAESTSPQFLKTILLKDKVKSNVFNATLQYLGKFYEELCDGLLRLQFY